MWFIIALIVFIIGLVIFSPVLAGGLFISFCIGIWTGHYLANKESS